MKLEIPSFNNKSELFGWLVKNQSILITQKKLELKKADSITYLSSLVNNKIDANKADPSSTNQVISTNTNKLLVKSIINTTKLMDSHSDVHIDGLWKKTLSESKLIYLLQEHDMTFEGVISDEVTAYAKNYAWVDLGYNYPGLTQALVFDSTITQDRNPYMFDQYQKGYVKNHSVGMQYVKLYLAINDPQYTAEFDAWNKYYPEIVNKDDVDFQGYFWAVTEAKLIEGSAVLKGSNFATPTHGIVEIEENKTEPLKDTQQNKTEPLVSTHENEEYFINVNLI